MTYLHGIGALALLASLSACGSPQQPTEDAAPAAEMPMEGPFAGAEMAMDKAIKAAVGVDAADNWVKKMIAHHEGAIGMSRIVLGLQPTADVGRMAQMTIDNQGAEIEALKALARSGTANPDSARPYQTAITDMHNAMMAASGATSSKTYLAKMLAHHRGAVAMSDIALANGATGAVRAQIEKTRKDQQEEVAGVEAMMRGEPIASPATPSGQPTAAATPKPTSRPGAAKPAAKTAAATTPKATEPATNPHAGHDMRDLKKD